MNFRMLAGMAGLILIACRSQQPNQPTKMNQDQLTARLLALTPENENELEALASELTNDARGQPRRAVQIWLGPDAAMSKKAAILLGNTAELSITPLLEAPRPSTPEQEAWLIRTVVQRQIDLRQQVAARLMKLLDDKRPVPEPSGSAAQEEKPPLRRLCDEAYLQLRRFIKTEESPGEFYTFERNFLSQPPNRRDTEIHRAKQSPVWKRLAEQLE